MTKEHKEKLKQAIKKNWQRPAFRLKTRKAMRDAWTPERRQRQREKMLGHKPSDEMINKISVSNINTWNLRRRNEEAQNNVS